MTAPWLRIDADLPWHDKVVGLSSDAARWAYVKVLCIAKQHGREVFSTATLTELLGKHGKHIPALVTVGLLDEKSDKVAVHDFSDYQRRTGHAEAQGRYRSKVTSGSPPESGQDHATITEGSREDHDKSLTGQDIQDIHTGQSEKEKPTTFMGYRPKATPPPERLPGEAVAPTHDGRHGASCLICAPMLAAKSIDQQQAESLADNIAKTEGRVKA